MIIPNQEGELELHWLLESDTGHRFGVGRLGNTPLWLRVTINNEVPTNETSIPIESTTPVSTPIFPPFNLTPGSTVVSDFYQQACKFEWLVNNITLPCHDQTNNISIIGREDMVVIESGSRVSEAIVIRLTSQQDNSQVIAKSPVVSITENDMMVSGVGCLENSNGCSVLINISFAAENGETTSLWTVGEFLDGQVSFMVLDLSPIAGKTGSIVFEVTSLGPTAGDEIAWISPRLLRNISVSPSPTISPTSTSVPTAIPTSTFTPAAPATPEAIKTTPQSKNLIIEFIDAITQLLENWFQER